MMMEKTPLDPASFPHPTRVAVITPYKNESRKCIERCLDTVAGQNYPAYLHVIVCDGTHFPIEREQLPPHVKVIELPVACEDTGATPRAIGSIFAIAQHCHALTYLDIDNTIIPQHIALAINVARPGGCVVVSERWICDNDSGEPLFLDTIENGVQFVDTNTLFLFGSAMLPGTRWWQVPRQPGLRTAGVDRFVWDKIVRFCRNQNVEIIKTGQPSVHYRSRWKHHYDKVNRPAPSPCKTLKQVNGVIVAEWME